MTEADEPAGRGEGQADGAGWFDPAAGARAIADVQRIALQAAGAVVDQMTGLARSARPPRDPVDGSRSGEPQRDAGRRRADAERIIDAYADFARMLLDGFTSATAAPGGAGSGAGEGAAADGVALEALTLDPVVAGATATGELWAHNLDTRPIVGLAFHTTGLTSNERSIIGPDHVTFIPAGLDELPARASQGVAVRVEVPADAPPGTYHGLVQATGLPALCLALRLDVLDPGRSA